MMRRTLGPRALLVLALQLSACGLGESAGSGDLTVSIDTVNGIPIVRNGPSGLWEDGEEWGLRAEFRIGSRENGSGPFFSNFLTSVNLAPDGRIFTLDLGTDEVRVFGREGTHQFTFGGTGKGPGELSTPVAVGWDGWGRLWIPNAFDGRYSVFDSAGKLLKTERADAGRGVSRFIFPMHFDRRGHFVDHVSRNGGVQFLRRDTTARVVDTLAFVKYPDVGPALLSFWGLEETTVQALRRFIPRLVWSLAPDGTIWFGRTDSLRLIHLSPEGDTLRIVEANHREGVFTESEETLLEKARHDLDVAVDFIPAVLQSIHVLEDGHVLAQIADEMNEPGRVFDVFDPDGRFLGSMTWPFAPHPKAEHTTRGDTIVSLTLGEFDVPYLVWGVLERTRYDAEKVGVLSN